MDGNLSLFKRLLNVVKMYIFNYPFDQSARLVQYPDPTRTVGLEI